MRKTTIIALLILLIVVLACATTKKAPKESEEKPSGKPPKGLVEDFDPMTLQDEDFEIEQKVKDELKRSEPSASPSRDTTSATVPDTGQVEVRKVRGFRVQIAALSNQEDADRIQKEAMLNFENADVYMVFKPPYYKVRVGDFVERNKAQVLKEKAVSLGYKNAWIVPTMVKKEVK